MTQLMLSLAPFLLITLAVWSAIIATPITRRALLHREPFTCARWDFRDILLSVGLYFACNALVFLAAAGWVLLTQSLAEGKLATLKPPEPLTALFVLSPIGALLAVVTSTFAIKWRTRQSLSHLGWSLHRIPKDVGLAIAASFLTLPLVYIIQTLITSLPGMEYEHPTMKILEDARDPGTWLAIGFTVIIVAPIAEEFFFRCVIQGWIEKLVERFHRRLPGTDESTEPLTDAAHILRQKMGDRRARELAQPLIPTDDPPPPPDAPVPASPAADLPAEATSIRMSWLHRVAPIFLSSFLFAGAHWNHGGGWVALLVFSFSLGFLYHKTHRLLPCILLHMALNTVSLIAFYVILHYPPNEMAS